MTGFYRVMRAIVCGAFRVLFRTKAIGAEHIPKSGGVILCCNHTSLTDVIFLAMFCPRQIFFMAKSELFSNKLLGWFLSRLGAFAVRRGKGDTTAVRTAHEVIENGSIMGIFPEGTRNLDGPPIRAKAGVAMIAAGTGAAILPVSIYRDGHIHLFSKTTVRFGEIIPFDKLGLSPDTKKSELKFACELIMQKITALWEMKH